MNQNEEYNFWVSFINQTDFTVEANYDRVCALWAVYCLHQGILLDSEPYDIAVRELWGAVAEAEGLPDVWPDFNAFDNFICKFLL